MRVAIEAGYLHNTEDRRGKPSKLATADTLPQDQQILPTPAELEDRCSVAVRNGGVHTLADVDVDPAPTDDGPSVTPDESPATVDELNMADRVFAEYRDIA